MNKNLITKQNTDLVLNKSKSTLSITSKILSGKTSLTSEVIEDWITEIWSWADENDIDISTVPRGKDLLLPLDTIDLSGLELDSITNKLFFLEYMTTFILEDNNIEELPKEIVNFKNLKILNLKNNPLALTNIQKIWIEQLKEKGCEVYLNSDAIEYSKNNDLVDDSWMDRLWKWADDNDIPNENLPRNKNDLQNLSFFEIKFSTFFDHEDIHYPVELSNLINLKKLSINDSRKIDVLNLLRKSVIKQDHSELFYNIIKKQTNLIELEFRNFNIDIIPKEIDSLIMLTSLNLNANKITKLPQEIFNLTNLTKLNISANQLIEVPKEIGNLINLTSIDLWVNSITELPKEIFNLTDLTTIDFHLNQLTDIPDGISNLTKLKHLDLWGNQITKLPEQIYTLGNLTVLQISQNQLVELSNSIGNLTNLTSLSLASNQLTDLPHEIWSLTSLTSLDLYQNKLTELPKEIGNLTKLTNLTLSNNQLTELPVEIIHLTKLKQLWINLDELELTQNQQKWILALKNNGCNIYKGL